MDRRQFVQIGSVASLAALVGLPVRHAGASSLRKTAQVRLFRLDEEAGRFLPHRAAADTGHGYTPLRLRFERTVPAVSGGVDELRVGALYASPGTPWRYDAWHYRRGDVFGSSRGSSFLLPRDGLHGLVVEGRNGDAWQDEIVRLEGRTSLVVGRYLLALAPVGAMAGLPYSGDPQRPFRNAAFDALSFTVEPVAAEIEEPLRADLACQEQATEDDG